MKSINVFIQIQLGEENTFCSLTVTVWFEEGVLPEFYFSPVSQLASSWWVAACGQSTLVLHPAASRDPPNTDLSCSSGRCAAAHWRPRMLAWPGKGRRRGGWPQAGGCPEPSSCRQVVAPQRWQTSRVQGSGERSLCPPHMTPASSSAGKTSRTGHRQNN